MAQSNYDPAVEVGWFGMRPHDVTDDEYESTSTAVPNANLVRGEGHLWDEDRWTGG